ncbi:hypothetical protein CAF53_01935 [Sphingobium sp. LB126]|nr:hypothetical protein CAF53_01935 [Sphingobium sp. LB126]
MTLLLTVHRGAYKDSVRQMAATRAMLEAGGVEWAGAFMATPANLQQLHAEGFANTEVDAQANDLVLAVRAEDAASAQHALARAEASLFTTGAQSSGAQEALPVDLRAALREDRAANIAMISVPGPYATLEAQKALSEGLHVMLFSDAVELADELALKQRARTLGRFVMGPGAGTSWISGTGFGFANRVRSGPVGLIAASGTGAQAVMCLLDHLGIGTAHAIGVGAHDLTADIGGLSARMALEAFEADEGVRIIILVSKQADAIVAADLLDRATKPIVAVLLGTSDDRVLGREEVYSTLEQGTFAAARLLGYSPLEADQKLEAQVAAAAAQLPPERTRLVGLFSGGTLCEEAAAIAARYVAPIERTAPHPSEPAGEAAHLLLDLGDEDHTRGKPHPMIDAAARCEQLLAQASDPTVAVVLLDLVIGEGSHPDPASVLAPAAAKVVDAGAVVLVCVVGAPADPQDLRRQREQFERAGCILAPTTARAAYAAVAIAIRQPAIANATEIRPSRP